MKKTTCIWIRMCWCAIVIVGGLGVVHASSDLVSTTQPNQIAIYDPAGPGGVATPFVSFLLSNSGSRLPFHFVLSDTSVPSAAAYFDVFYDGNAADFPSDPVISFLTMNFGASYSGALVDHPTTFPVSKYLTTVTADLGAQGTHQMSFVAEINPAQPGLAFTSSSGLLSLLSPPFDWSWFPDWTVAPGSPIDPTQPLFRVTIASQQVPEPATIVSGSMALLALAAVAVKRRKP